MTLKFTILGCGSSMGVPRPDGSFGNCDPKNIKNYRTRCSALIKTTDENILIDDFKILSVYPNPFNPIANIEYSIGQESNLSINIYDINGREIEKLFEGYKDSGSYSLSWNASEQATGVYFIKFKVNNTSPIVHRLVLIK